MNGIMCALNCTIYGKDVNSDEYYSSVYDNKCTSCYMQNYYYYNLYQAYCQKCEDGYFPYDGSCFEIDSCEEGSAFDQTRMQCVSCEIDNCLGCKIKLTEVPYNESDQIYGKNQEREYGNESVVWSQGY